MNFFSVIPIGLAEELGVEKEEFVLSEEERAKQFRISHEQWQEERQQREKSFYSNNFFKISAITSGLALPRVSFITLPTINCKDAVLPFL